MTLAPAVFPFTPYLQQELLMGRLREYLRDGDRALVESPTGTGKSLMIWFSAHNWLREQRSDVAGTEAVMGAADAPAPTTSSSPSKPLPDWVRAQLDGSRRSQALADARIVQEYLSGKIEADAVTDFIDNQSCAAGCVVYASRTHVQLQQTQRLFSGSGLTTSVVAGRAIYCVHTQRDVQDIEDLDQFCKNSTCACRDRVKVLELARFFLKMNPDYQQAREEGDKRRVCPYYAQKVAACMADAVFVTQETLADEIVQPRYLKRPNTAVFCDEAHGILEVMEDRFSYSGSAAELRDVVEAIQNYLARRSEHIALADVQMLNRVIAAVEKLQRLFLNDCERIYRDAELCELFQRNKVAHELKDVDQFVSGRFPHRIAPERSSLLYKVAKLLKLTVQFNPIDFLLVLRPQGFELAALRFNVRLRARNPIIFIGGTLQPFSSFKRMFHEIEFQEFVGDHVISGNQLKVLISRNFEFSFELEQDEYIINILKAAEDIRRLLGEYQQICVFFPSKRVVERARAVYGPKACSFIYESENAMKQLKIAPMGILIAAVGGRFSEGMDFRDDLCRAIIIPGIPFSNSKDLFVKAKGGEAERAFRIVNETIGRVVRWAGDWGRAILLDSRYLGHIERLSPWIARCVVGEAAFADCNIESGNNNAIPADLDRNIVGILQKYKLL